MANRLHLNPTALAFFSSCREITIPSDLPLEDLKIIAQQFPKASLTIPLLLPVVSGFYMPSDESQDVLEKFQERVDYIHELSETHQVQVIIQFPKNFASEEDKKMVVRDLFKGLEGSHYTLRNILANFSDSKAILDDLGKEVSVLLNRDLGGGTFRPIDWSSEDDTSSEDPSTSETDFSDLSSEDELWILSHMINDPLGKASDR